jgi:biotin carboxylase
MESIFVVLEPVNHAFKVIEAAARRGLKVVVFHSIDFPESGPYAAARAHISEAHKVASWNDHELILDAVRANCDGGSIVGSYAIPEVVLELNAKLQAAYGLSGNSPDIVRLVLDKQAVRARLRSAGLSKLASYTQDEAEAMTVWPVEGRALYFKPVHGTNSAYVFRCESMDDLRHCRALWEQANIVRSDVINAHLRSGAGYFLDEDAAGELMSVEGHSHNGVFRVLGLMARTVLARNTVVEMGATFPYPRDDHEAIIEKVRRIHELLGVRHGFTHTEIMVDTSGNIELIELNIRFAGADALLLLNAALGVNLEDHLVMCALGEPSDPLASSAGMGCASMQFLMPRSGEHAIDSIEFPDMENLTMSRFFVQPGTRLETTDFETDRIASLILTAPTYTDVLDSARAMRERVRINNRFLADDRNNVVILR